MATCVLALSACQPQSPARFAEKFTTAEERTFAESYLRLMQHGAVDSAYALLTPDLKSPEVRDELAGAGQVLAAYPPVSLELIGVEVNVQGGSRSVNLSWQYRSQGQWVLTNVAAVHSATDTQVYGFSAWASPTSLTEANSFNLRGKGVRHYVWFGLLILNPLVCFLTAVRVATARGLPKRWLWATASLFGVFAFSLDWTSGVVRVSPLSFYILGAAAFRAGPAAPWVATVAFPLGAVLALGHYRAWRSSIAASSDNAAEAAPAV